MAAAQPAVTTPSGVVFFDDDITTRKRTVDSYSWIRTNAIMILVKIAVILFGYEMYAIVYVEKVTYFLSDEKSWGLFHCITWMLRVISALAAIYATHVVCWMLNEESYNPLTYTRWFSWAQTTRKILIDVYTWQAMFITFCYYRFKRIPDGLNEIDVPTYTYGNPYINRIANHLSLESNIVMVIWMQMAFWLLLRAVCNWYLPTPEKYTESLIAPAAPPPEHPKQE